MQGEDGQATSRWSKLIADVLLTFEQTCSVFNPEPKRHGVLPHAPRGRLLYVEDTVRCKG
jgi:hypothetical protein